LTLLLASTFLVYAYALPSQVTTLSMIYSYLQDPIHTQLDAITSSLSTVTSSLSTISSSISSLSTALGTVGTNVNTLLGRLTSDRADNLDSVSTELGSETGVYYSYDPGSVDLAKSMASDLARFTVTVGIYQGDSGDFALVYMSQDGTTWNMVFSLMPGANTYASRSETFVAQKIWIQAFNVNSNYPGTDSGATTITWAFSAVGSPNLSLTDIP